jgi:peptidoglycan/LPS O-acetylase OafA/YrhL
MYGPDDARATLFPTHLRIDSLFCGVLLAYAYHFFPDAFQSWTRKHARLLTVAGVCAFVPAFVFPMEHSDWVLTIGLTGLALGSACFVSTAVAGVARPNRFLDAVAYVGSHSYSIYLWQGPVDAWLLPRFGPAVMSHWGAHAFVFISLALLVGIGFARLTETPALRLRDRLFPSKGLPLAA